MNSTNPTTLPAASEPPECLEFSDFGRSPSFPPGWWVAASIVASFVLGFAGLALTFWGG